MVAECDITLRLAQAQAEAIPGGARASALLTKLPMERAWGQVDDIIRANSITFYFATRFLPGPVRRAVHALYAFCRMTDDLVDVCQASAADMENWRRLVERPATEQDQAILACWAWVRERYRIDRRYQNDLIDGVIMDCAPRAYATWEALQQYCYRVASTVGLLSIPLVGLIPGATFDEAAPYAIKLGLALQLTNILRDVGEDARRGRVYLPEADLAQFGLGREDILAQTYDQRLVALLRFETERARALYREGLPGLALLSEQGRLSVGVAALLYAAILDEIAVIDYRVFQRRAHTSALRKFQILPIALLIVTQLPWPVTNLVGGPRPLDFRRKFT